MILNKIQEKQLQKEEIFKADCSSYMPRIESCIKMLRTNLDTLRLNKKEVASFMIKDFVWSVHHIGSLYESFIRDLNHSKHIYATTFYGYLDPVLQEKIEYMHKKKKEYRIEFEKIYGHFKQISKGVNFPRRNEILKLMRRAFDFDSSVYYSKEEHTTNR